MNISRKTFVHQVAVAVIAVGLAGCSMLAPAEPAGEVEANAIAEAPASDVMVDQAVATDDEDVVEPDPEPEPKLTADDWTLDVPQQEGPRDFSVRPPSPERLFDYLPEASVLNEGAAVDNEAFRELRSSPDHESAVGTAQVTLAGVAQLVNEGKAELFAPATASTCAYCLGKLRTAYELHDAEWVLEIPWGVSVGSQADVHELSGSDHLWIQLGGEETTLAYKKENQTQVTDLAGTKMFNVEMLFDQGQWWVLGMSTEEV